MVCPLVHTAMIPYLKLATRPLLSRAIAFLSGCVVTYIVLQATQSDISSPETSLSAAGLTTQLGTDCQDLDHRSSVAQRGAFWILNNYVPARRRWACGESITYTTHGDVTFLDNVVQLVERWDGPISFALHAPGTDYETAMMSIAYLRQCSAPKVSENVAFHLVFDESHFPADIGRLHTAEGSQAVKILVSNKKLVEPDLPIMDCTQAPPWTTVSETYKQVMNLTYPVNVLRNVARTNAATQYILASDVELYPSLNVIAPFFDMIRRNEPVLRSGRPRVFTLPIFEVYANQSVPDNKAQLVRMLRSGAAVPFHENVCAYCHATPKLKEWLGAATVDGVMRVAHVAKRHKPYEYWEPIFIGTQRDPLFDERLTWEGKGDKFPQAYALCMLGYEFMVLDNAFLVHRPGVKLPTTDPVRDAMVKEQFDMIQSTIFRELKSVYGRNRNCYL